jgi:uncharacterized secreted protein with C-terminal beta-propeller domain
MVDNDNKPNKELVKLIGRLRDEDFGNKEQRQEFVKIITQIALSTDEEARRFIKKIGNFASDYLMKHEEDFEVKNSLFKKLPEYKITGYKYDMR